MATKQADKKYTQTLTLGLLGSVCMAVAIHALLLLVLSTEMHWTRDTALITMEAELWSTLPVEVGVQETEHAAPRTNAPTLQDTNVPPPSQPASPNVVVEQEIELSDDIKLLLQDQQEQRKRKREASKLKAREEAQESRDETVRDPT